ncbi:MAG: uroporphyrinogen-III C-methyltransferase [Pedosphaera sp.]|nr:uroporphyrinogen-III C-methyltransferase [Pedosphaera sp.]
MKKLGIVYLIGAGPGDPGLLTVRGAELLARADVVVHDALANPELLILARAGAEFIDAGKRSREHTIPQAELNRLLIDTARAGKVVVRLKGGDPYVFGRGGEEAEELAAAGVPFEVVPGISSAVAAPNYAGIPLTHRDHCAVVQVITGHEDPLKPASRVDWAAIARVPGTKVIMMGVERIRTITQELVTHGLPATTPVAMIRNGTTNDQKTLVGTVGTIADLVEARKFSAPAVTIIGDVVSLRKKLNWFEGRPLSGQRIVVTRTRVQASQLSQALRERGAGVWEIPTLQIVPPLEHVALVEAISGIGSYDWLVFTSPNGVTAFFDYFFKAFDDIRALGALRIAAVGPATAAKLKELHLRVDVTPDQYVARKITDAINQYETVENLRFLLMRAEVASPELPKMLEEKGGIVDDVACYRTIPETEDRTGVADKFRKSGADWLTFTSASTVENFHARFDLPKMVASFQHMKMASIGPETSGALAALGLSATVEAKPHTIEGLVASIVKASRAGQAV